MLPSTTRRNLAIALVPLLVLAMLTQSSLDPKLRELNKGQKTAFSGLTNEFILGPLLGLQQAVAGLLWVRADEFFHEGDYDAILPIVRMVTWLDPHQLDVYITGAWHLANNFTDASERSDRRYLPASQKLLEEGDENNSQVYDIAFELGWQNTDKTKDYARALHWYEICTHRRSADETGALTKPAPMYVWHQKAHALARLGRIDESIAVWREVLARTNRELDKNPKDWSKRAVRDSEKHNLQLTLLRKFSRELHEIDWNLDPKAGPVPNLDTGEPTRRDYYLFLDGKSIADKAAKYREAGMAAPAMAIGSARPPSLVPPWDCAFDARPIFSSDKVMEIMGRFNVGDGARVTIRMHDENWRPAQLSHFTFNVDLDQTLFYDQHSVRGGTWGRKIDMSKDPKMYGFKSKWYYLVFEFNPRGTSPFIQDRFGWSGEGMTDKKYLWVDKSLNPPVRLLRKVYKIRREQIFRQPITEADVVSNDEYDRVMQAGAHVSAN